MRKGRFTQVSTAQKLRIDRNTKFATLKSLTMNSSNTTRDMTQTSRYDEVNIPVVAEVVGASENDEQIPN